MTPSTLFSLAWTRAAQAAQVIPPMANSKSAVAGAASVSGLAAATSTTSRKPRAKVLQPLAAGHADV